MARLPAAADTRRSVISNSSSPELLWQRVLPQFKRWRRRVWAVQTDDSPQYCLLCNVLRKIDHRVVPAAGRQRGFIDAVLQDLNQDILEMKRSGTTIDDLQAAVDSRLWKYNHAPVPGFPCWGRSPAEEVRSGQVR